MTCAIITDYRELLEKYENENEPYIIKLKEELNLYIRMLYSVGFDTFYTNCHFGIPLWAAEMICEMKKEMPINLRLVIPYEEQASSWSEDRRDRYFKVHEQADRVIILDRRFEEKCFIVAEELMVSRSDRMLFCQRLDDEYFPHYLDAYDIARTFLYF